jgi:hypothetical protein
MNSPSSGVLPDMFIVFPDPEGMFIDQGSKILGAFILLLLVLVVLHGIIHGVMILIGNAYRVSFLAVHNSI